MSSPSDAVPTPRSTTRQREAGAATRLETQRRLVLAAANVFSEHGYAGATVVAIAARAGVSLQTLYSAWGSKRALLRAYQEYALGGSPTSVTDDTWRFQAQAAVDDIVRTSPGAEARLRAAAAFFRRLAERSALAWQLYQDAAAVDPQAAADRADFAHRRRGTWAAVLTGLDVTELRPGIDLDRAVDSAMAIASPATYDVMVRELGYSLDRYQEWVADTLVAALVPDRRRPALTGAGRGGGSSRPASPPGPAGPREPREASPTAPAPAAADTPRPSTGSPRSRRGR